MSFLPLHLTSPHMHGSDVKDAQWLLSGHNRFKTNFHPGPVDGDFGRDTGAAVARAKNALGYPTPRSSSARYMQHVFGDKLYAYLLTKNHRGWKPLPRAYQIRRAARQKQLARQSGVKNVAANLAEGFCRQHYTEHPAGSNDSIFGGWYGLNRNPWCAMFVTYCFLHAGDRRIFRRGSITAYAFWPESAARSGHPYLRITSSPERGDLVIYHHNQGHIGIFDRWENRASGKFLAYEGNTADWGGSQDNGGACIHQHRDTGWVRTVFVRVIEPN